MKKLFSLSFALILTLSIRAQVTEGDALLGLISSKLSSPATQKFFSDYKLRKTEGATPLGSEYVTDSTEGINVSVLNDSLTLMTFYWFYPDYGSYTHKLPKGISFNSTVKEVIKKLGKATFPHPVVGYYEYVYGKSILVCHFNDFKVLDMVIISPYWPHSPDDALQAH
jgi:hypothetical protein